VPEHGCSQALDRLLTHQPASSPSSTGVPAPSTPRHLQHPPVELRRAEAGVAADQAIGQVIAQQQGHRSAARLQRPRRLPAWDRLKCPNPTPETHQMWCAAGAGSGAFRTQGGPRPLATLSGSRRTKPQCHRPPASPGCSNSGTRSRDRCSPAAVGRPRRRPVGKRMEVRYDPLPGCSGREGWAAWVQRPRVRRMSLSSSSRCSGSVGERSNSGIRCS
jgi:hypothetical protein